MLTRQQSSRPKHHVSRPRPRHQLSRPRPRHQVLRPKHHVSRPRPRHQLPRPNHQLARPRQDQDTNSQDQDTTQSTFSLLLCGQCMQKSLQQFTSQWHNRHDIPIQVDLSNSKASVFSHTQHSHITKVCMPPYSENSAVAQRDWSLITIATQIH